MTAAPLAPLLLPCGDGVAEIRCSRRGDGDFHRDLALAELEPRRRGFVEGQWTQPDERHGTGVLRVTRPGEHDGVVADAVVTDLAGAVLGIWVGDCAPVALVDEGGQLGAVHAGWRGAMAGVLARAAEALQARGAVSAYLGPCIHPCCYEFGVEDLHGLVRQFGRDVAGRTVNGRPALDVPAMVAAALRPFGIPVTDVGACTGCAPGDYFSHRRGEPQRQVVAVWKHAP